MAKGGPPLARTFFIFPGTKYATKRLSGDQKGYSAPSVSSSCLGMLESSLLIQSEVFPAVSTPTKAREVPSGESAMCPPSWRRNSAPEGG
jgi:hypothetical protein